MGKTLKQVDNEKLDAYWKKKYAKSKRHKMIESLEYKIDSFLYQIEYDKIMNAKAKDCQ